MSSAELSVFIRAIGVRTPERKLTNAELSKMVDTSDEWIQTRSGISERRIAGPGENPSDLGAQAAAQALQRAGLTPADVDLLIVATMTPDVPFPSTACLLQAKLGLRRDIPCFDVSAACSGFVYALQVAKDMMRSGAYRRALVVGAEKLSSVVDWSDRTTCVLFGDGAGAVLLETTTEKNVGLLGNLLGADGNNAELLHCAAGGSAVPATADSLREGRHFLRMNGKEVFRFAVTKFKEVMEDAFAKTGLTPADVSQVICHQSNVRIIDAAREKLNIDPSKIYVNIDRYGNSSAGSVPLCLDELWRAGKITKGKPFMMVAFGGGLTWASSVWST